MMMKLQQKKPAAAQVVFVLGLELPRRHVVQQQAQPAPVGAWVKHFPAMPPRYLPVLTFTK
jgi:hypothetical protein